TTVADQANYPNGAGNIPVDVTIRNNRLLTGSDFDVEGIARGKNGVYYFGDEFGPFIIKTDANGRLLATPVPTPNTKGVGSNQLLERADYPTPSASGTLPARGTPNLPSSGGFEGFTISPDKSKIYAMFEKSLIGDGAGQRRVINVYDTATDQFLPASF